MSNLVPADQIERIVGVRRHQTGHYARAVSDEQVVYILHSHRCKDSGRDLRECPFSLALDRGIDPADWATAEDKPWRVTINRSGATHPRRTGNADVPMNAPDPKVVALLESRPTCEHEEEAWREHDASIHCHVCDAQVLADAGIGDVAAVEAERDEWKRTARHTREWALGEVRAADARVAAVAASVLALHRPDGSLKYPHCVGCWEAGGMDGAQSYPCPTVRAVESTDAAAALVRVRAEERERIVALVCTCTTGWMSHNDGHHHADCPATRIEAEAGDPS